MKRHLRAGLYRGGKLVDDRWIDDQNPVTIGTSADATFTLVGAQRSENLPEEQTLFQFRNGRPVLHVVAGMDGELALDGIERRSLASLRSEGQSAETGDSWTLELPETVRGWVSVGDSVVFVQVAEKPAPPPPMPLPPSIRTGLLGAVEKSFVAILVVVLALEAVAIAVVHQRPDVDPDGPVSMENLDRFAQIIMPDLPKDLPKPKEEETKPSEDALAKAEEARKEEERKKKDAEAQAQNDPERAAAADSERRERLREEVRKQGLLQVIGATGGSGSLANVFASSTGFSDDIGAALAGAGGVRLATGDDGPQRRGGGTGGEVVGIGDLGTAAGGGRSATLERKKVVPPQISIDDGEFETESSSVSKESLGQYIRPRLRSVQQCYERELKRNPGLRGKIVVRFVITTAGRVGEVSIESNSMGDDNVAACISMTIKRWVFPIKPEDDAAVSFPFVFSPGG